MALMIGPRVLVRELGSVQVSVVLRVFWLALACLRFPASALLSQPVGSRPPQLVQPQGPQRAALLAL